MKPGTWTADEFRAALRTLGLSQVEYARLVGRGTISVNQFACGRSPVLLIDQRLLEAMLKLTRKPKPD